MFLTISLRWSSSRFRKCSFSLNHCSYFFFFFSSSAFSYRSNVSFFSFRHTISSSAFTVALRMPPSVSATSPKQSSSFYFCTTSSRLVFQFYWMASQRPFSMISMKSP